MPPIVAIIGKSGSGKTSLIQKLVPELRSRGYRVATIKHIHHNVTLDQPDKDSWRHVQAGSEATAIRSHDRVVVIRPVTKPATVEQIAYYLGEGYDIVLAEGFKESEAPKIEVHRKSVGPLFTDIKKLVATVTDEPLPTNTRQFSPEDIKGLADLLEEGFIKPQRKRAVVYINGAPVNLPGFPKELIRNTLLGMVASLKGIGQVNSLEIFLRENPE